MRWANFALKGWLRLSAVDRVLESVVPAGIVLQRRDHRSEAVAVPLRHRTGTVVCAVHSIPAARFGMSDATFGLPERGCGYRRRMTEQGRQDTELPPRSVRRLGAWAVGNDGAQDFAVSRRCRHQLADLSKGHIDADGCLVCPWHQSRYDVGTGEMVAGPHGFLGYHGRTPGYTQLVLAYGRRLRLQVRRLTRTSTGLDVR